jgi:hypothetical protein
MTGMLIFYTALFDWLEQSDIDPFIFIIIIISAIILILSFVDKLTVEKYINIISVDGANKWVRIFGAAVFILGVGFALYQLSMPSTDNPNGEGRNTTSIDGQGDSKIESVHFDPSFTADVATSSIDPTNTDITLEDQECPVVMNMTAQVEVTTTGEQVRYYWVRDGNNLNQENISFKNRNLKSISYNETFGENGENEESHSYQIKFISPPEYTYETTVRHVTIECKNNVN